MAMHPMFVKIFRSGTKTDFVILLVGKKMLIHVSPPLIVTMYSDKLYQQHSEYFDYFFPWV